MSWYVEFRETSSRHLYIDRSLGNRADSRLGSFQTRKASCLNARDVRWRPPRCWQMYTRHQHLPHRYSEQSYEDVDWSPFPIRPPRIVILSHPLVSHREKSMLSGVLTLSGTALSLYKLRHVDLNDISSNKQIQGLLTIDETSIRNDWPMKPLEELQDTSIWKWKDSEKISRFICFSGLVKYVKLSNL